MLSSNFLRHLTRLSLVAASLVGLSARALEQDAPSLALVDQVVQAYGGAAQIERVVAFNADGFINASVRQKGGTYKRWFKRPRMLRVETAYPGSIETRVLNGELAWRYSDSSPMMSVITQFDGLTFTNGDGQSGQDVQRPGQQNGTGIATGAVLASGG